MRPYVVAHAAHASKTPPFRRKKVMPGNMSYFEHYFVVIKFGIVTKTK
jgi:hypothetical protein